MPFESARKATKEEENIVRGRKPHIHQQIVDDITSLVKEGTSLVVIPATDVTYEEVEKRRTSIQTRLRDEGLKMYTRIYPPRAKRYNEPANYSIFFSTEKFKPKKD